MKPTSTEILNIFDIFANDILGIPFDRHFKRYIWKSDKPCPMWKTQVSIADKKGVICNPEQIFQLAYRGSLRFYREEENEDSINYLGMTKTDKSYNCFDLEDEESVAYIGDDIGNAQVLIYNILNNPDLTEQTTSIRLEKEIDDSTHKFIYIGYFREEFIVEFSKDCRGKWALNPFYAFLQKTGLHITEEKREDKTIAFHLEKN